MIKGWVIRIWQRTKMKTVSSTSNVARQMEQRLAGLIGTYGDTALLKVILNAVEASDCELGNGSHSPSRKDWEVNPRTLLTVLAYCYAVEIYPPEDIEDAIDEHPAVSYLATRNALPATAIRRFRREHRALLARTLTSFFEGIWVVAESGVDPTQVNPAALGELKATANLSPAMRLQFARLAEEHIHLAILWDGPALRD